MANITLQERFKFYRERNAAPLAYYFARQKHAAGYTAPSFLVVHGCTGYDHGKAAA